VFNICDVIWVCVPVDLSILVIWKIVLPAVAGEARPCENFEIRALSFNQNKMTNATYGTGTAYPSGTSDVTKVFTDYSWSFYPFDHFTLRDSIYDF
jgi:hypothetical protein